MDIKTIIGIVTGFITIVGAVWIVNITFATNQRVTTDFEKFEIVVAGAIQNTQMKSTYLFYQLQYDKLNTDLLNAKRQLRDDPNNPILKQDYQDIKDERDRIKINMENILKEMK